MYNRETNSGHTVEWEPEDSGLAARALAEVPGTGVSTATEAADAARVDLGNDSETARQVREQYQDLLP